jgi:YHS domain-containing protein
MKKISLGLSIAIALALSSCNQKSAAPKMEEKAAETKMVNIKLDQLASKTDFNCNMTLEEGSIADTASYEGKVYGFCSSECKAEFMKDPKAHLAQK